MISLLSFISVSSFHLLATPPNCSHIEATAINMSSNLYAIVELVHTDISAVEEKEVEFWEPTPEGGLHLAKKQNTTMSQAVMNIENSIRYLRNNLGKSGCGATVEDLGSAISIKYRNPMLVNLESDVMNMDGERVVALMRTHTDGRGIHINFDSKNRKAVYVSLTPATKGIYFGKKSNKKNQ